jgi:AAA+ ATPase superfamily predicted ATPase
MSKPFFGRRAELLRLRAFGEEPASGFLAVRGRRRIGKSWLLTEFRDRAGAFYFQGDDDSSSRQLMKKFAGAWNDFSGDDSLSIIRIVDLDWARLFKGITEYCRARPRKKLILILDEIQWIAKKKSGFVSQLKESWLAWEKSENVKIIICGSSQRFFAKATSRDSSVLYRLRTAADLWVQPFSLSEIRRHYFPQWTHEQICLLFMMTGGVPYYLDRVPTGKNFIRAINQTFFTENTIFLDEFKEVLNLEFNKTSSATAAKILKHLGQDGATLENIRKKSRIRSESTVRTVIDQLVEYQLVAEKSRAGETKENRRGTKFYIRDPFLNFYFQVLQGMAPRIRKNHRDNLFDDCLGSKTGYYIENFSGGAFELLTEWVLSQRLSPPGKEPILKKLELEGADPEVGHHWMEGKTQIDLVVENAGDRESRLLELKWINKTANLSSGYLEQVKNKDYSPPEGWTISYHLLLSKKASAGLLKKAGEENVQVLGLADLFAK